MAITHGNVAQLIGSVDAGLAGRVWSQWHSYSFDISGWEIFGALCMGPAGGGARAGRGVSG
ncbi:linear gramicidin synthetase subunit D domain protein [Mycobacterium xenopi 3993]|nr:linear gramicidin synthetase subunit D domain protein [Mycobacterium xenopi 3993]